jgi:hypothetical protein
MMMERSEQIRMWKGFGNDSGTTINNNDREKSRPDDGCLIGDEPDDKWVLIT